MLCLHLRMYKKHYYSGEYNMLLFLLIPWYTCVWNYEYKLCIFVHLFRRMEGFITVIILYVT